jgi:hypothetical protein
MPKPLQSSYDNLHAVWSVTSDPLVERGVGA